jgi:3-oxoadipate enol-lactonase
MPRARVNGIELYYELSSPPERDDPPRLLFLSGSGGDLRDPPRLSEGPLARHFELLGYDQRGLGQSEIPDGPYAMGDYAEDAAALLDHVGWDRCAVLGVSFGGMVAQEFAVRHPGRVERLVLACTSPGGGGGGSYPLHELASLPEQERLAKIFEVADARMDAAWRAANPEAFQRMAGFYQERGKAGAAEPRRELGQRLQLEARKDHDVFERLPSLAMPVFCCGGRYDGIAPPANMEAIEKQVPGATLELFDGGHLFLMQDPAAFPKIIRFLKEDSSS